MSSVRGVKAFTGLEIARFLCAFSVILYHYSHFFVQGVWVYKYVDRSFYPLYPALWVFYTRGFIAVPIFWMISGFIFFWKYEHAIGSGELSGGHFFILRFSRLYPLHFVTLIVVTILQMLYSYTHTDYFIYDNNNIIHFLSQLSLASNWFDQLPFTFNGPIWSVSVEVLAYALFFVAVRFQKPNLTLCLWVAFLAYAVNYLYPRNLLACIVYFFVGGAIAKLIPLLSKLQSQIVFWICTAGVLATGATTLGRGTVIFFAVCFVTACAVVTEAFNAKLFRLAEFGNLTYASYLLHFPIQLTAVLILDWLGISRAVFLSPIALAVFLVGTFGLSWVIYRTFEMPVQEAIRAFALGQEPRNRERVATSSLEHVN